MKCLALRSHRWETPPHGNRDELTIDGRSLQSTLRSHNFQAKVDCNPIALRRVRREQKRLPSSRCIRSDRRRSCQAADCLLPVALQIQH